MKHTRFTLSCVLLGSMLVSMTARGAGDDLDGYDRAALLLAASISDSASIDASLAVRLDAALDQVRAASPGTRIPTVADSFFNQINVKVADDVIAERWGEGVLESGDAHLDRIAQEHGLVKVSGNIGRPWFTLEFDRLLNLEGLCALYQQSPKIEFAERDMGWVGGCGGMGGMWILEKGQDLHLVFARGSGDCLSGCITCDYAYFTVSNAEVTLVDEVSNGKGPRIHRWNVPARFSAKAFGGLDEILSGFEHDDWWVRRHAIEVAGRLLASTYPNCGEDLRPRGAWKALREQAIQRRAQIVDLITMTSRDDDADVAAAAQRMEAELAKAAEEPVRHERSAGHPGR